MANNLGLTHSDVEARHHGLTLSATTSPTATQVDSIVDEAATDAESFYRGLTGKLASDLTASDPAYTLLRRIAVWDALAEFVVAHTRSTPESYQARLDRTEGMRDRLRTYIQDLGSSRPTGDLDPGIFQAHTDSDFAADVAEARAGSIRAVAWQSLSRGEA